ncbi:MAG: tetratricopeptide repeat protein [Planctomycetota bacterium]
MTPIGPLRFLLLSSLLCLPPSQNGDREIRNSLLARDYGRAVTLLGQELERQRGAEEPKHVDRLLFLLANTELVAGKLAEAEKDFHALLSAHPDSRWRNLAEFGLARALAKGHRFQDAAELQQKAIARLLSDERRVELSETYVGLATEALKQDPPDRKGAIAFLDLAIGLELPEAKEREHARKAAALAFEAQDWNEAARRYEALVLRDRSTVFASLHGKPVYDLRLELARSWRRAGRVPEAAACSRTCSAIWPAARPGPATCPASGSSWPGASVCPTAATSWPAASTCSARSSTATPPTPARSRPRRSWPRRRPGSAGSRRRWRPTTCCSSAGARPRDRRSPRPGPTRASGSARSSASTTPPRPGRRT